MLYATGADGTIYVLNYYCDNFVIRTYGKDGKYLRTIVPPAAAELGKAAPLLGGKVSATAWGDESPLGGRDAIQGLEIDVNKSSPKALSRGWSTNMAAVAAQKSGEARALENFVARLEKWTNGAKFEIGPCPAVIPEYKGPPLPPSQEIGGRIWTGCSYSSVDYARELLYVNNASGAPPFRFDGQSGTWDSAWKDVRSVSTADQVIVGYDDLIYWRGSCGGISFGPPFAARMTQDGQKVPFQYNRSDDPALARKYEENPANQGRSYAKNRDSKDFMASGSLLVSAPSMEGDANHDNGWDVAPNGNIVIDVMSRGMHRIAVFDHDGKLLAGDVVKDARVLNDNPQGDGVYMDRDGNVYVVYGMVYPDGVKYKEGFGGGGLFKFRGQGGKYPLGQFHKALPADAIKLRLKYPEKGGLVGVTGALWVYSGAATAQSFSSCNCPHTRFWLDRFARSWVPAMQVSSVMLLDSNGNRIARLGQYGNVDDTEADVKAGKDGLRFVWVKSVCASDTTLYAVDYCSLRILQATLTYAAEETVPVP
jgi:hypothetical protein